MSVRILLVDDHQVVREGVRAILERDAVPWTIVMFRAVFDEQPVC